jgi:hypothetical protein
MLAVSMSDNKNQETSPLSTSVDIQTNSGGLPIKNAPQVSPYWPQGASVDISQ